MRPVTRDELSREDLERLVDGFDRLLEPDAWEVVAE
jgi:hypothetical protein